jgi:hypothetical protein
MQTWEPPVQNIRQLEATLWVVVKMGDNNWMQDVSDVLINS